MSSALTALAQKKWFVPALLILMALIALSSLAGGANAAVAETKSEEERLAEFCDSVRGVSNAKVMITYETLTVSSGFGYGTQSGEGIRGIAVVCDGGDDPTVKLKLYTLIGALYQVQSTKISVSGRG